jgi:hypothetical protein
LKLPINFIEQSPVGEGNICLSILGIPLHVLETANFYKVFKFKVPKFVSGFPNSFQGI